MVEQLDPSPPQTPHLSINLFDHTSPSQPSRCQNVKGCILNLKKKTSLVSRIVDILNRNCPVDYLAFPLNTVEIFSRATLGAIFFVGFDFIRNVSRYILTKHETRICLLWYRTPLPNSTTTAYAVMDIADSVVIVQEITATWLQIKICIWIVLDSLILFMILWD